jgi:uncharacterized membrane protein
MSRPILKTELKTLDWIIEVITVFVLIGLAIYLLMEYRSLPGKIATHYGFSGNADTNGSKSTLWVLIGLTIVLYGLLTVVSRFPQKFNYPIEITEKNAPRQYSLAIQMMRLLKLATVLIFTYLTYITISLAQGNASGLGSWFLPITLISIFGIIIFYTVKLFIKQS